MDEEHEIRLLEREGQRVWQRWEGLESSLLVATEWLFGMGSKCISCPSSQTGLSGHPSRPNVASHPSDASSLESHGVGVLSRGVQPAAHRLHAAQDGCECSPTQNCKFTQIGMRFFCDNMSQCI